MSDDYEPCHYRTLGVSRDATREEIKAAFRQRSKETHPDVAGHQADADRFKRISNAARILTNVKERQAYDNRNMYSSSSSGRGGMAGSNFHPLRRHNQNATASLTHVLVSMFTPRNMILGPVLVLATVSAIQYTLGMDHSTTKRSSTVDGSQDRVQAWKNPATGRYETAAPWDPVFQRLQPTLESVPRDQVHTRHR